MRVIFLAIRIRIPHSLFLIFLDQALQKAIENKEVAICASLGIDREKGTYVVKNFIETNVIRESEVGVTYLCHKKDVVIHTHLFGSPIPSGIDIQNMKKDNTIVKIGKVIRPPNPVFYLIGGVYFQRNELSLKLAGYSLGFRVDGCKIDAKGIETRISQEAYNYLSKLDEIEYGVVYFTRQEIEKDKIEIKKVQRMEDYFMGDQQVPNGTEVGYFVTGISDEMVEPQDYILAYYVLDMLGQEKATVFKLGERLNVFEISKLSKEVSLAYNSIDNVEVLIGD